jgi:formate dehydrogenase assembly factor FdhD
MTAGKLDLHWTANGWKRTPKLLKTVKKIAKPPTRKTRKLERVAAAIVEEVPTFQQARKLAAAKLAEAQFVAAVVKDVRRHRLGHYDDISKV